MNVCGSPEPISLITKKQKRDVKKCIICQNSKDKNKNTKLATTEEGRKVIIASHYFKITKFWINTCVQLKNHGSKY